MGRVPGTAFRLPRRASSRSRSPRPTPAAVKVALRTSTARSLAPLRGKVVGGRGRAFLTPIDIKVFTLAKARETATTSPGTSTCATTTKLARATSGT
eukprot:1393401-Heterocapsa_arctica.AAC.1